MNKAYDILKPFLTSLYYSNRILPQLIIIAKYNNVIRVTEEIKINLMIWWSINIVNIYIQELLADFTYFLIKTFSEGYN